MICGGDDTAKGHIYYMTDPVLNGLSSLLPAAVEVAEEVVYGNADVTHTLILVVHLQDKF